MFQSNANSPRRWWVAALLALVARGVGQLYNGQVTKALLAFLLPPALLLSMVLVEAPALAQLGALAFVAVHFWAVADAIILAIAQRNVFSPTTFDHPVVYALAIAVVFMADVVLFETFVVRTVSVPSGLMHPAVGGGDIVLSNLLAYTADDPQRGDVIVFRSPVDDRRQTVSRIIGLPGETIEVRDKRLLIDGIPFRENWGVHSDREILWPPQMSPRDHFGPVRVAANRYFVLDDNRDVGFDSRHWQRSVHRHQIEGRLETYLWSRNPQQGVRWHRIGRAVHRGVPVPIDAPARLYESMGHGRALPVPVAMAIALLMGIVAILVPLREAWCLRRDRLAAGRPFSVTPKTPACASEAVRQTADELPNTLGAQVAKLQALTNPAVATRKRCDLQTNLADCLATLRFDRADASGLAVLAKMLREIAMDDRVTDRRLRGLAHWRRAATLHRLGRLEGDVARIREAIEAYGRALGYTQAREAPLSWAAVQNDLATALQLLGELSGESRPLEEAVRAYQDALGKRTRRAVPLDWATTQNNLGNALRLLGEREGRTRQLERAVRAYEAALLIRTPKTDPIGHAMTLNNLGTALRMIGARRGDAFPVERALHLHLNSQALLDRWAPNYAEVPAQNVADDLELLQRLGLVATEADERKVALETSNAAA